MTPSFGEAFRTAIEAKKLTVNRFARLTGIPNQNLYEILDGKRKLPLKHLDKVIQTLGEAIEPSNFRELCLLDHSPAEIRKEYLRMKAERR